MAPLPDMDADTDIRVTQARLAERIQDLSRRVEATEHVLGEINQRLMLVLGGLIASLVLLAANLALARI